MKERHKEAIAGVLFISPWLLGFLVFMLGPIIASFVLSFYEWDAIFPPEFVGWSNYRTMFLSDHRFLQSLKITGVYVFIGLPFRIALSLGLALLLNQKLKGVSFFRTIFYSPTVVSGVALAVLWMWMFNPDFGLINRLLALVGITGPDWLFSEQWALPAIILMSLWSAGGNMIIYLGGLQGIPTALYEAAELDGAGWWNKFVHITIPMLTPIIFFNLIVGIINNFQVFTQAFVMTNGGPNNATLFYVLYLYNNAFRFFKVGYASAMAVVLFLIILALTIVLIRTSDRWVHYEGA